MIHSPVATPDASFREHTRGCRADGYPRQIGALRPRRIDPIERETRRVTRNAYRDVETIEFRNGRSMRRDRGSNLEHRATTARHTRLLAARLRAPTRPAPIRVTSTVAVAAIDTMGTAAQLVEDFIRALSTQFGRRLRPEHIGIVAGDRTSQHASPDSCSRSARASAVPPSASTAYAAIGSEQSAPR